MITTKVLLRKDRMNNAGKCPLNIRITKSRKSCYLTIGVKLKVDQWDHNKQRVKKNKKSYHSANALIRSVLSGIEEIAFTYDKDKISYNAQMIKEMYLNKDTNQDVIVFADNWMMDRYERKEITISTVQRYQAVIEKVKEFTEGILTIKEFNYDFLASFELYLQRIKKNSTNTIASNFSFLRAVANALIQKDLMKLNDYPFKKWKLRYEETERKYISLEQIAQIESINLPNNSKIAMCRDIFIFCNQTGLRIGDGMLLRLENYTGSHIHFKRQKSKNYGVLPLTNKARLILEKYITDAMGNKDFIFSFLSHKMQSKDVSAFAEHKSATALINKNLGIICNRLGYDFKVSTHYARHSMATNALANGLSMEEIQGILGHKDIRTTQIYAKAHDQMIEKAIEKLNY